MSAVKTWETGHLKVWLYPEAPRRTDCPTSRTKEEQTSTKRRLVSLNKINCIAIGLNISFVQIEKLALPAPKKNLFLDNLDGGHVDDVSLVCVVELDVPVGEVVQPGQLASRKLYAAIQEFICRAILKMTTSTKKNTFYSSSYHINQNHDITII